MCTEVVIDGLAAGRMRIVVDDAEAAWLQLRIERLQGVVRGLEHVAVEPQDREAFDRRAGERVLEPALQEDDLVVQQAVAPE